MQDKNMTQAGLIYGWHKIRKKEDIWIFFDVIKRLNYHHEGDSRLLPAVAQIILQHAVQVPPIPEQRAWWKMAPKYLKSIRIYLQSLVWMDQLLSVAVRVRAESVDHHLIWRTVILENFWGNPILQIHHKHRTQNISLFCHFSSIWFGIWFGKDSVWRGVIIKHCIGICL